MNNAPLITRGMLTDIANRINANPNFKLSWHPTSLGLDLYTAVDIGFEQPAVFNFIPVSENIYAIHVTASKPYADVVFENGRITLMTLMAAFDMVEWTDRASTRRLADGTPLFEHTHRVRLSDELYQYSESNLPTKGAPSSWWLDAAEVRIDAEGVPHDNPNPNPTDKVDTMNNESIKDTVDGAAASGDSTTTSVSDKPADSASADKVRQELPDDDFFHANRVEIVATIGAFIGAFVGAGIATLLSSK